VVMRKRRVYLPWPGSTTNVLLSGFLRQLR
jgi:hypothetical protein